jgi:hypothetical protein
MPLIITNVWQGTRTVSADFIELAHVLRMPARRVMVKIYLPTILPYFFSGARLAFGFGWRVSLVAETLGSSSGVGYRLRQAADLIQTDQVFAWTLTLVVMMAVLEMGLLRPLSYLFAGKGPRAMSTPANQARAPTHRRDDRRLGSITESASSNACVKSAAGKPIWLSPKPACSMPFRNTAWTARH